MGMDITAGEERMLQALCASHSPLGCTAMGLSKVLGISHHSVSTFAISLEHKGLCTRERVGMRIYLHATPAGIGLVQAATALEKLPSESSGSSNSVTHDLASLSLLHVPPDKLVDSQAEILAAVARSGNTVVTRRLVELTGLSDRAIHRQATRLYAKGLLFRTRQQRRWVWILTTKGRTHLAGSITTPAARKAAKHHSVTEVIPTES